MKYETAVPIAKGGIAEVLRAYDPSLRRHVALKLLRYNDPLLAERMVREAQAQARVSHPNVCPVYETGTTDDGQLYISMQYIEGETLDVAAAEMSLEEKLRMVADVASAVQAAHAAGLIHRDLKPGNILVERQEDGLLKPWVVDFGLARQRDAPGVTISGQVMGTPAYMPPEQARGEHGAVDRRSDIYALGAVLYHLLTGRPPYTGQSTIDVLVKILQTDPEPVRKRQPRVPADVETITMKCLEKDPGRRYSSARALADDLRRFLDGEPILARPSSLAYRILKKTRKHRLVAALIALVVVGVPAGGVKYALDLHDERRRALAAQRQAEDLMDFMLQDLYQRLEPLGRVELLGEVARKSLAHYEDVDSSELDAATLHRRAQAFRNVGLVLDAEGDLEASLNSFERSRSIMAELHGRDPDRLDWLHDLAVSHQQTGEVLQEQGRLDEALASYRRSLELGRELVDREPQRAKWQEALWDSEGNLGWLALERGELDAALGNFQDALALASREVERRPSDAEWRYKQSVSLAYLGIARQDQGADSEALASFHEALAVMEELAGEEPENAEWQFELSLDHGRIAYLLQEQDDLVGARGAYQAGLAIIRRLSQQDASNARWQRELAVDLSGLAAVLRRQGDLAGARDKMEESLAISRRLAARDPSNASRQNDLAWDLIQLGMVHEALDEEDAARHAWEEALAIVTPVAESTDTPYYLDTQVMALLNLGRVAAARPIVERLLATGWDDPEFLELCRRHGLLDEPRK